MDLRAVRQDVSSRQRRAHSTPYGPFAAKDPPRPSEERPEGSGALPKKGLREALKAAREAHPNKRLRLFFQDEARVGQKGWLCHRWWIKGQRPPGVCDQRFDWTYLFAAADPASGHAFALVLPTVSSKVMDLFLKEFSKTLAEDEHTVMVLDGAGWHNTKSLTVPSNITLVHQPPYAPECNPVERIWLFLRERLLSLQVLGPTRVPSSRLAVTPGTAWSRAGTGSQACASSRGLGNVISSARRS